MKISIDKVGEVKSMPINVGDGRLYDGKIMCQVQGRLLNTFDTIVSIIINKGDVIGMHKKLIINNSNKKKESVMKKEKKKVIFKILACRICGEQGGLKVQSTKFKGFDAIEYKYKCPINPDHKLDEFSLPYEMKLKQEINLPEVERYIRVFTKCHGNRSFIGKVVEVDKENNTVSYCHDNFAIEKVRSFSINQFGWKYLKEV